MKISQSRKDKGLGNKNAKGYKHTVEERQKISAASKRLWQEHRQKMLSSLPRGEAHIWHKPPELRRYRKEWTPVQRREWKDSGCAWCGATDKLVLDHILPIFMGGERYRENAQTLCNLCNLWKLWFIERPMWQSLQVQKKLRREKCEAEKVTGYFI